MWNKQGIPYDQTSGPKAANPRRRIQNEAAVRTEDIFALEKKDELWDTVYTNSQIFYCLVLM